MVSRTELKVETPRPSYIAIEEEVRFKSPLSILIVVRTVIDPLETWNL